MGRTSKCRRQVAREMMVQVGGGAKARRVGRARGCGRTGRTVTGQICTELRIKKREYLLHFKRRKGGSHTAGMNRE